jgi:DNA end-binding protein Ku
MAWSRKGVALTLGLISTSVRIEQANEKAEDTALRTICVGQGTEHEPVPITMRTACPTCGEIADRSLLRKGKQVGDGYVVVTQEEVAELKHEYDDAYKKKIELVAHPLEQVLDRTDQGDKTYVLLPEGTTDGYLHILNAMREHPELALVGRFTPTSRATTFMLVERDGVIVAQERVAAAKQRTFEAVEGDVNPAYQAMVNTLVDAITTDFDPSNYEDSYAKALTELVANREVVPLAAATDTKTTAPKSGADLAALAAYVEQLQKAKAPRKTRTRKAS